MTVPNDAATTDAARQAQADAGAAPGRRPLWKTAVQLVGFAMGLVGVVGFGLLISFHAAIIKVGVIAFDLATNYAIGTVPLFLFMAHVLFASGIGQDLYDFAARMLGHRKGGLAMATVGASAGFAQVGSQKSSNCTPYARQNPAICLNT